MENCPSFSDGRCGQDRQSFTVLTQSYQVSWYHSESASGCCAIGCVTKLSSDHESPEAILLASLAIENESAAFLFMAVPRNALAPRDAPPRAAPAPARPRPRRGLVSPDIMPPRTPAPRPPRIPMPRPRAYRQQPRKHTPYSIVTEIKKAVSSQMLTHVK